MKGVRFSIYLLRFFGIEIFWEPCLQVGWYHTPEESRPGQNPLIALAPSLETSSSTSLAERPPSSLLIVVLDIKLSELLTDRETKPED